MGLKIGIVGLPNAGKSTLFNALAGRRLAETAPRPFTTINPHEAAVSVPDKTLDKLSLLIKPEKTVAAAVSFIDIAGLVKGAHQGEGLGNQFLAKIRETDALAHVVRGFPDADIPHPGAGADAGAPEQIFDDLEIVNTELRLGNIAAKPTIYVLNISEIEIDSRKTNELTQKISAKFRAPAVAISAKLEEELLDLDQSERTEYLQESGVFNTGLEKLIQASYRLLGLITFYTVKPPSARASAGPGRGGGTIVTAWSSKPGITAMAAAGKVHTDFAKNFIKAEVISAGQLLEFKNWKEGKEKGKVRLEGRDYPVADGEVIEFKVSI